MFYQVWVYRGFGRGCELVETMFLGKALSVYASAVESASYRKVRLVQGLRVISEFCDK